jgi:hypothetical protein
MEEQISHGGRLYAVVLRSTAREEGIRFFGDETSSLQLGYMSRPTGYVIAPHVHNPVKRHLTDTMEVLFIRSGRARLDLFTDDRNYFGSTTLGCGDVVLLAAGGHGLVMNEDTEIVEVKQGPYVPTDKTKFEPIDDSQVSFLKEVEGSNDSR